MDLYWNVPQFINKSKKVRHKRKNMDGNKYATIRAEVIELLYRMTARTPEGNPECSFNKVTLLDNSPVASFCAASVKSHNSSSSSSDSPDRSFLMLASACSITMTTKNKNLLVWRRHDVNKLTERSGPGWFGDPKSSLSNTNPLCATSPMLPYAHAAVIQTILKTSKFLYNKGQTSLFKPFSCVPKIVTVFEDILHARSFDVKVNQIAATASTA